MGNVRPPPKVHVVLKSDVDLVAPYVVGVFFHAGEATDACKGPGTYTILACDPNRVYRRGQMLDAQRIEIATANSLRTLP